MGIQKVLVVEDSPTMAQLLVFTLRRVKNVDVATANDGVEGLKRLTENKYDLVLTDINMPLMDGLKLIRRIRSDQSNQNKDVPIIIITTEGEEAVRDEGISLGANSYITKPINSKVVVDTVKKFLAA